MATTQLVFRRLYLVGSLADRGPCGACGAIAELHLAEEDARAGGRLLAACLPCAERPARVVLARAA